MSHLRGVDFKFIPLPLGRGRVRVGVIPQGPHLLETSKTSVYNEPKA
jgi:hypothetical protein